MNGNAYKLQMLILNFKCILLNSKFIFVRVHFSSVNATKSQNCDTYDLVSSTSTWTMIAFSFL